MSSLRNSVYRRAHKERSQPQSRKKFGLLEKHKDYVARAQAFHKKEETLRKLKEKAAFRNPDEFYFKMIKTKTVDGIHQPESVANKYSHEELMLMKTQDIGYVLQKIQSEKKKIERLSSMLHSLDNKLPNKHLYYAEDRFDFANYYYEILNTPSNAYSDAADLLQVHMLKFSIYVITFSLNMHPMLAFREEAKEIQSQLRKGGLTIFEDIPEGIKRKTASSYTQLEARKKRVKQLEKLYRDMTLQKELQKKGGKKRKLREDELEGPATRPVYKWQAERKR
ncbi:U3 small nucleolar RNA-associated protein 11 [Asimina triloba]